MEEGEERDVPQVVRRSTITTNLLFRLRKKKCTAMFLSNINTYKAVAKPYILMVYERLLRFPFLPTACGVCGH